MAINTSYNSYGQYYGNSVNSLWNTLYGNKNQASSYQKYSGQATNAINYGLTEYVTGLKSGALSIKSAIGGLKGQMSKVSQVYASSDTNAMTIASGAKVSGSYKSWKPAESVRIESLASGQKNTGAKLVSKDTASASLTGSHTFEIEANGAKRQFSININEGDTNRDVQERMAAVVNGSGIGVKAAVEASGEYSTLKLEAQGTGTDAEGTFAIRDVSGSAVQYTGISSVAEQAKNAKYYLGGSDTAKTSRSNTVDIGGGVSVTFRKATNEAVKVTTAREADGAVNAVKQFANSYNNMYSLARDNGDAAGSKLFNKLVGASRTYASSLAQIGVEFNAKGEMTVNEERLNKAGQDGSLNRFWEGSGKNYGFFNQLNNIATDVQMNTGKYVSRDGMLASLMGQYGGNNAQYGNQYNLLGLLFDFSL